MDPAASRSSSLLSLTKLQHFRVLARNRNFAAVADELGITQPALSRSLASLERDCGSRLVQRSRGVASVHLTDVGLQLLTESEQLLRHARRVTDSVMAQAGGVQAHIRIGIGPLLLQQIMPGALLAVMRQFPRATFETVSESPAQMGVRLHRGELDIVVAPFQVRPADDAISATPLGGQTPTFQVRQGHPLAGARLVTMQMLADYPLVAGTVWNEMAPLLAADLSVRLAASVEVDNIDVLGAIVRGSDAVLVFSIAELGRNLCTLNVDIPPRMRSWASGPIEMLTRKDVELPPPAQAMIAALRTEFRNVFRPVDNKNSLPADSHALDTSSSAATPSTKPTQRL
ncbi:LysR family transcriptional regulator [Mycolicibacterium sp. CH28]|uniref:LysR family transcriptional regulator n=1 Tax=Mycolicibacterium sp. CH28 TaxID=2512237 RepID=UPI0010818AA3|nr:LysR family transcriptional regulator [Mycolicibacterium sp. CH28]TGD85955.1 LysR family transcriptional regulator [Mycolicibacterium sp. CH28]